MFLLTSSQSSVIRNVKNCSFHVSVSPGSIHFTFDTAVINPDSCSNSNDSQTWTNKPESSAAHPICSQLSSFSSLYHFFHLSQSKSKSKSKVQFQSPSQESKSRVQVKSPSLKSKVWTLNSKDLDLEWLYSAVSKFYLGLWHSRA